jgi:hypothetical protein
MATVRNFEVMCYKLGAIKMCKLQFISENTTTTTTATTANTTTTNNDNNNNNLQSINMKKSEWGWVRSDHHLRKRPVFHPTS